MEAYTHGNIQATGFADAAYRIAVEAQRLENDLKFKEAKDAHMEAANLYLKAKEDYAHSGGEAVEVKKSLSVLAKTHNRQAHICE